MKPYSILLFITLSLCSLGAVSLYLDANNIKLAGVELMNFDSDQMDTASLSESKDSILLKAREIFLKDSATLAAKKIEIFKKPSRSFHDTLLLLEIASIESSARFYYDNSLTNTTMDRFFDELEQVKRDNTFFRIIHYGDSQIEMDRISSFIREKLQRSFGGSGPGLLPALEVTPKYTVAVQTSGDWTRKLTFGSPEFRSKHNKYGPMAYFCVKNSPSAKVLYTARDNTSYKNRSFNTCKVIIGANSTQQEIKCFSNNKLVDTKTVEASSIEQIISFSTDSADGKVALEFNGGRAEILGVSLENKTGVALDNIPMRGGSGLMFANINAESLKRTYQALGVKMVILQYGGNALPGMSSKSGAEYYGKRFYDQITYLKSIDPQLIVFVIGPADMSVKRNGELKTHEHLEELRDAMKSATLRAGGVFWDMYEAMGGNGSMIEWVRSKPSLGSPDYIHFTTKGAQKISEIFYQSLMNEYEMYKIRKKTSN